ncbi:MAG: hypothetical protein AB1640_05105 [bacterium]
MLRHSVLGVLLLLACAGSEPQDWEEQEWQPDLYVAEIPVIGGAEEKEIAALERVGDAIQELYPGIEYTEPVIFVRDPDQKLPELCSDGGCADTWREYPKVVKASLFPGDEWYGGLEVRGKYIFVSRIGADRHRLTFLLCHEFSHFLCRCPDGEESAEVTHALFHSIKSSR